MFRNNLKIINNNQNGLTLVELMVVVGIFMFISSIAIFNYSNFNSTVSLQNLTDDIALSVRKAQNFAIGARGVKTSLTDTDFYKSYGIHFSVNQDVSVPLAGTSKSFLIFNTTDSINKEYDLDTNTSCGNIGNECVELFNILSNDTIKDIVAYNGITQSAKSTTSSVDIVFKRPDPRAYICYKINSSSTSCESAISSVDIVVSNGYPTTDNKYKIKTISIQNTGQISIK